jgi:hypothetical protein
MRYGEEYTTRDMATKVSKDGEQGNEPLENADWIYMDTIWRNMDQYGYWDPYMDKCGLVWTTFHVEIHYRFIRTTKLSLPEFQVPYSNFDWAVFARRRSSLRSPSTPSRQRLTSPRHFAPSCTHSNRLLPDLHGVAAPPSLGIPLISLLPSSPCPLYFILCLHHFPTPLTLSTAPLATICAVRGGKGSRGAVEDASREAGMDLSPVSEAGGRATRAQCVC